jgi:hypothetical protein
VDAGNGRPGGLGVERRADVAEEGPDRRGFDEKRPRRVRGLDAAAHPSDHARGDEIDGPHSGGVGDDGRLVDGDDGRVVRPSNRDDELGGLPEFDEAGRPEVVQAGSLERDGTDRAPRPVAPDGSTSSSRRRTR